jgi:ABC-type multidrug transport system permease subunit
VETILLRWPFAKLKYHQYILSGWLVALLLLARFGAVFLLASCCLLQALAPGGNWLWVWRFPLELVSQCVSTIGLTSSI